MNNNLYICVGMHFITYIGCLYVFLEYFIESKNHKFGILSQDK